ncbi:CrcB family protein [Actinomyces urogenitalis]|uniref:fluoride efflux transporter FluC n=1 Tax=Actinomyces urogenitalis TaxID=103621 RepID=UPI0029030E3E|nr:CrcB family protein [Actinomyces urogenitalis]MDU0863907.1 CrcB family protein [Actinomyces urogenitalis]MDU0874634.1 CrcB family protein [Actinomyces urogenitalis]MDU1564292.1 CrcB family protein [Actinomyces urogenitalis]MDU1639608.1 CrcB family protein [Actinomyces urogenitalis]MDU5426492.1 CrcB family protein [Actinomyces urogenitalis]
MSSSSTATTTRSPSAWVRQHQAPLAVFAGGALGTLVRAGLARLWPHTAGELPTATLAVNLVGALALGFLLGRLALAPDTGWRRTLRLGLGTGFMGGLTTYSTFIVEVEHLAGGADLIGAATYLAGSLVAGVALAAVGLWLAGLGARRRTALPTLGEPTGQGGQS